jgi:hypothetical protein
LKKLLLLLLLSLAFLGSANANSIKGAFGYELGQFVKDAKIYGGHDPFSWFKSETDFIPKKPLPMLQNYQFSSSVISKKIYYITGSTQLNRHEKPYKYLNCHFAAASTDFGKLLRILESKYGDFELTKLNDDKWEPLIVYQMTYEFKDGNRRIYLSCSDILDGDYSLYLSYSDSKLRKQADEEEEQMISNSTPDYDI